MFTNSAIPLLYSFPIVVATGGQLTGAGGISASAPIFAALIASVNDARIAAGKSTVGWANPAVRTSPVPMDLVGGVVDQLTRARAAVLGRVRRRVP